MDSPLVFKGFCFSYFCVFLLPSFCVLYPMESMHSRLPIRFSIFFYNFDHFDLLYSNYEYSWQNRKTYLPFALLLVYNRNMKGPCSPCFAVHGITTYRPLNNLQVPNKLLPLTMSEDNMCSPGICILYILFSSTCYKIKQIFY